jgi:hypothetical protein
MTLKEMRQQAERECLAWKHPVGTKVGVIRDDESILETVTRPDPFVLGHRAVILVEATSGCYLLSRVAPLVDAVPDYRDPFQDLGGQVTDWRDSEP